MGKYSTDSDSDQSNSKHKRKHRRRSRSSSSSSSTSSHRKRSNKYSKPRRRHYSRSRSRGRDKTTKNYKRRSGSRDRDKRRPYRSRRSKSPSTDRTSRSNSQQKFSASIPERFQTITIKDSILDEINSDSFTPKTFTSQKDNKLKNIIIDITTDTIQIPTMNEGSSSLSNSVFHSTITLDQEARFDRWVKKLYTLRQKAITDNLNLLH